MSADNMFSNSISASRDCCSSCWYVEFFITENRTNIWNHSIFTWNNINLTSIDSFCFLEVTLLNFYPLPWVQENFPAKAGRTRMYEMRPNMPNHINFLGDLSTLIDALTEATILSFLKILYINFIYQDSTSTV